MKQENLTTGLRELYNTLSDQGKTNGETLMQYERLVRGGKFSTDNVNVQEVNEILSATKTKLRKEDYPTFNNLQHHITKTDDKNRSSRVPFPFIDVD